MKSLLISLTASLFWGKILTCTSIVSNSCTLIFVGEKTLSPPPPFNFGIHAGWLIFGLNTFLSFLPAGTLMYVRLLMYPVQMPSLMYLIIAKKQRITFFDPPVGQVGRKIFSLIVLDFANHWAPFPDFCVKQVLAEMA